MKKILVLPGDGIGQEVCTAALPVFDLLSLPITLSFGNIGWECWRSCGNPIPEQTWQKIDASDAVLLGAITSKGKLDAECELDPVLQEKGLRYVSPVIQLRQKLELFANIRPVYHLTGNRKPFRCAIIRENTEGLYAGMDRKGIPPSMKDWIQHPNIERSGNDNAAISVRLQTRFGLERLFRYAFEYTRNHRYTKVTFADKPNVLRDSGQFAADIFYATAADYPEINAEIQNVDAVALWLVSRPESFGVMVAENMFGDILSDLAGGVMGGLGVAPSANIGSGVCYFEPVHGSAPNMAGQRRANPSAMFLTIALMLRHLGFSESANRIKTAVQQVIYQGKCLTYDLGGTSSTNEMAEAILSAIMRPQSIKRANILCIGNELLSGRIVNSNATEIGQRLTKAGYTVGLQMVCADQIPAIRAALDICIGQSDFIIVNGGLGPTSDDLTRNAIAAALNKPLQFDVATMRHIEKRLSDFGLPIDPSNHKQAMFPQGATILQNPNGTAPGFEVFWQNRRLLVLPGPPGECLPILDRKLNEEPELNKSSRYSWLLLGVIEADIATAIDKISDQYGASVELSYLWRYPYVEVGVTLFDKSAVSCLSEIDNYLAPYLVSKNGLTALSRLKAELADYRLHIDDPITRDVFTKHLPATNGTTLSKHMHIKTSADRPLTAPWQGVVRIRCEVQSGDEKPPQVYQLNIPHRGPEIVDYACEFIAWSVLRSLNILTTQPSVEGKTT